MEAIIQEIIYLDKTTPIIIPTIPTTTITPIFLTGEGQILTTEVIFLEVIIIVVIYSLMATITTIIEAIISLEATAVIIYSEIKMEIIITIMEETTMAETISLETITKTTDITKTICLIISWVLK
jgi:hypothetical protein